MKLMQMKEDKITLKLIWFFVRRYKFRYIFLIGLAIFIGILESLNVALVYPILAGGLGLSTTSNPFLSFLNVFRELIPIDDALVAYCIIFLMLAILSSACKIFYYYFSGKLTSSIITNAKQDVLNKCMSSDYQFFIDNKQGEILYKTTTAPNTISTLLHTISAVFVELFLSISVFILLLSMSWKGTILILIGGIGYYYVTKFLSKRVSYMVGKMQLKSGQTETVIINEYTTGVKQIKVFNTFPYWKEQFNKAIHTYWKYHRKGVFWSKVPEIMLMLLLYLCIGSAVIFIKIQTPDNFENTLPLIGTFGFAVFMIIPKLSNFGRYRMSFMTALPNVEAVYKLLKDKTYNKIKNGTIKFTNLKTGIQMKNANFAHKTRANIINDASLTIKESNITALVGPSGSGKSTIVNLLLRLYDVNSGGIYIDGVNIKEFDIYTFLRKVGFVGQETFIHNAPIKENITFGDNYTDKEIIEAAKLANIHDFVEGLPDKYNTLVGDRGAKLSGGEKQRIAIARAMIRKPEILILDEATSSLDNISENIVQKAINKVSKNCTTVIIAHRLSTIKNADMIYVIDDGTIVESGSHKQLLNKKGKYWELYNIQKEN